MALSPTEVSAALLSIPEKKDTLRKAFGDLEQHRALIASCSLGWTEIDASLSAIFDVLEKRYAEIVEKEANFEKRIKELQEALDKRENVIESREQASLARVQEQKDAAVAAIREQKRKWIEEKQLLQSQSAAKANPDSAASKAKQQDGKVQKDESGKYKGGGNEKDIMRGKEKEDLVAKKDSKGVISGKINQKDGAHSELQKVKDNSSGASQKNEESSNINDVVGSVEASLCKLEERMESKIATDVARDSAQKTSAQEQAKGAHSKSGSAEESKDDLKDMETGDEDVANAVDEDASNDDEKEGSHRKIEIVDSVVVTARPELISFCEKMDGRGLYKYMISRKKVIKELGKELPIAMESTPDPAQLVLQAIGEYQPPEPGTEGAQGKKIASRRSRLTLLESLAAFHDVKGKTANELSDDIKEGAKTIADLWKSKLNPKEGDRGAHMDVQGFLWLVATFGLASHYSEEELCDLVVFVCFHKQLPKLWRAFGLADKTSDLVDRLIKDVKHLDAISFVQEFHLAEKFPPVNLLKDYLREMRKGHTGSITAKDKDELHLKELNAAKAVLKCVEKHKLEGDYPVEGLQRRMLQLEKLSLGEKKRVAETHTSGPKKARAINGPGGPFRLSDRFGGRGNAGRSYGSPYARGGVGGYPFPPGGRGYPSSYTHGSFHYGGGSPYQGPYLR